MNRIQQIKLLAIVALLLYAGAASARTAPGPLLAPVDGSAERENESLPDAPQPQMQAQSVAADPQSVSGTASITGTVADTTGAVIPGAQVTLSLYGGGKTEKTTSGADGRFAYSNVVPGTFEVVVTASGFGAFTSDKITVIAYEALELPVVSLVPAGTSTEIVVRPTDVIAAEQLKIEEKQRLLGVFPNYYVSYIQDAAPLTTKQKFSLASHQSFDWTSMVGITIAAGVEQANNTYAGYGQGTAGYAKRWAAQFADGRSSDFFGGAIFASLFHQDPRYFYQGVGTKKSRLFHAVSSVFIARGDNGRMMPNYSYVLGTMASGALSNAYYPQADRGAHLVFENAGLGILGRMGGAIAEEFLFKKVTKHSTCWKSRRSREVVSAEWSKAF